MDKQLEPMPVTETTMELWEQMAISAFPGLLPGAINWPMIVRSLIAEVHRLREHNT